MSEEEDTEASREAAVVPERYDPTTFTEDDDKGRLVVNLVCTSVIPLPGMRWLYASSFLHSNLN